MADTTFTNATQILEPFKGVKKVTIEEYFTSGHRTCQGCESALVMKLMVKAAGPRTIVLGSTGCMYVANTTYYTTPWVVPWMHTQLGSSGSAALGTAAGLKALMRKGKMKAEPINVIAFCGDGGGADMGLAAISATLSPASSCNTNASRCDSGSTASSALKRSTCSLASSLTSGCALASAGRKSTGSHSSAADTEGRCVARR